MFLKFECSTAVLGMRAPAIEDFPFGALPRVVVSLPSYESARQNCLNHRDAAAIRVQLIIAATRRVKRAYNTVALLKA